MNTINITIEEINEKLLEIKKECKKLERMIIFFIATSDIGTNNIVSIESAIKDNNEPFKNSVPSGVTVSEEIKNIEIIYTIIPVNLVFSARITLLRKIKFS